MKLELKHLAPYLPYNVSVSYENLKVNAVLTALIINLREKYDDLETLKMNLRPLSDFTKEIELNGEKFIPNHDSDFKYFIKNELDYFINSTPTSLNYNQMQKLLEWHFDIFGLIDAGLAISIHDVEQVVA